MPRIVVAVGVLRLYARIGLVGTSWRLVLGHTVLAVPYVVITMMAVLKTYDERLDQAAASLGASPWRTLVHITLPADPRRHDRRRFLFAFITSFDELTISLFVSGGARQHAAAADVERHAAAGEPDARGGLDDRCSLFVTVIILAAEVLRRRAVSQ